LFFLVGLAFTLSRLKIQDFGNPGAKKYVMAAFDAFLETETPQELRHRGEGNVCIRIRPQNLLEKFSETGHSVG
jgi:hypothetical protein